MPQKRFIISVILAALLSAVLLCLVGCQTVPDGDGNLSDESSSFPFVKTASQEVIDVSAHSAILVEMQSGSVVYRKNADEKMAMASTTKIMTALVALENCELSRVVTVSPEAVGVEGSSVYLFAGERITMEDLLYALLLSSANDAAAAIAIEVGGSIEGFADMMNARAQTLGLENTHFTNPHGLYDDEHYTTARELAIIAREAMAHEIFAKIVATYKKSAAMIGSDGARLFVNHNKLLKSYDGACGIKTGFTKKSGRCLVSCAERDGLQFLCVTLNAPDDWRDHAAMLDYGYSLYENKTLCLAGQLNFTLPVVSGDQACVQITNTDTLHLVMPRGADEPECTIELPRFVFADVRAGQIIGYAVYIIDGREVARCPLVAQYSVTRINYKKGIFSLFG